MKLKPKTANTVAEVAKYVGVSPAAVSSVLSEKHVERRISASTVAKIRAALLKMKYMPNMAGRRLRSNRNLTRQIDLAILTSFEAPLSLVSQILRTLQIAADRKATAETRYFVTIEMFHAGQLKEKIRQLGTDRYHGIIITNTVPEDDKFLEQVILPYVAVVLGRHVLNRYCVHEEPDFAGTKSAKILLSAGCKNPVILHSRLTTQTTSGRLRAFSNEIHRQLGHEPFALIAENLQATAGYDALNRYFRSGASCDGLFAVTDALAIGAYKAIKASGRSIPGDVSVVGIGDNEFAEFFDPALTTVAGKNDAMVDTAVSALFRLLGRNSGLVKVETVVPKVYIRDSVRT